MARMTAMAMTKAPIFSRSEYLLSSMTTLPCFTWGRPRAAMEYGRVFRANGPARRAGRAGHLPAVRLISLRVRKWSLSRTLATSDRRLAAQNLPLRIQPVLEVAALPVPTLLIEGVGAN